MDLRKRKIYVFGRTKKKCMAAHAIVYESFLKGNSKNYEFLKGYIRRPIACAAIHFFLVRPNSFYSSVDPRPLKIKN